MNKETIIRKLTSRKLWMAIALFVSGLLVAFGKSAEQAEVISGLIMQGAAVLGYLLAEGLADMSHAGEDEKEVAFYIDGEKIAEEANDENE